MNTETKKCQNCSQEFIIEPEDFLFYEKIKVPPPTWCPECRMVRRFVFRQERFLFRQKDIITGKEIFSGVPPQAPVKIYAHDYWWSDKWDSMEYGRDYDFSRPFFEQFRELMYAVPWPSKNEKNMVDSEYCDQAGQLKKCYLCFNCGDSEYSAYVKDAHQIKNSFDLTDVMRDELSYESRGVDDSYRVFFSIFCFECNDIWFSRDCLGCSNCFGCVNLRNKQYHIFNKPYAKVDYFEELKRLNLGSYKVVRELKQRAEEFWSKFPNKFMHGVHNTNVSGETISYSKNAKFCFSSEEIEDSKYCQDLSSVVRDSYDYTLWGEKCELMYEVLTSGDGCKNIKFSWDCWPADQDVEYSVKCASSTNLFGCVGLKKKSYCVFNKQYSKKEYFSLREKIIRHMNDMPYKDKTGRIYRYGEFFPPEFSPFAYNETIANDFFPLTQDRAIKQGYEWRDPEKREYKVTVDAKDLPDHIRDVKDSMLKEIIGCMNCGKAWQIIPMELEFYKKMGLPLPRLCPDCRYFERTKYRNPPKIYHRKCQCAGAKSESGTYRNTGKHLHESRHCPNGFETSYAPERRDIVYCGECYNAEAE